jgi:ubiquinone/menaquinone biosynthesis C-methylase UbiE
MQSKKDKIELIYRFCKANCSELERWPSYFHRRALEMQSYVDLMPETKDLRILELGCGIGYQSAMLAKISKSVVATDLPNESVVDHAPGMAAAAELHKHLEIDNVNLVPCSAEELPFEDSSMDMVFSSHVLEHIPNQQEALNEIYRVLKPGGYHVCIVPVRFEKLYAFISFYSYLLKASLNRVAKLFAKNPVVLNNEATTSNNKESGPSILKSFPFPPPHGYSNHFLNEWKEWGCTRWRNKVLMGGKFNVIHQSTTQLNPLLPLVGPVFPILSAKIHQGSRKLELQMGKLPIIRTLGINTVIIATSNKPTTNAK